MSKKLTYEKLHNSAEHYNSMIWTVFSVAVALSLYILYIVWPAKTNLGAMQFFIAFLGMFILFYGILAIESFNQKKSFLYKLSNKKTGNSNLESKIKKLPFYRIEWLAEIILLMVFISYNFFFWFVWNNNSLATFGKKIMLLDLPIFILSLVLFIIIIANWARRPKNTGGNLIEKIRKSIFGNCLVSYDDIISKEDEE